MISLEKIFKKAFATVGVTVNGDKPWDIQVRNPKLYNRIIAGGSIGFGEAYMDGWWDCEAVDEFMHRVLYHRLDKKLPRDIFTAFYFLNAKFKNRQTLGRAKEVAYKHYDIGNELFEKMLDKNMMYSCGYWEKATNLEEAQEAKLDLICRKLKLEKGMTLLEIGCGWGTFAKYVTQKYGVSVVGITISDQQAILARKINEGLPVEIRVQDYRDVEGKFDRVVSIAMLEAVGYRNFRTYMEVADKNLTDNGIFFIHTIGGNYDAKTTDPWIDKYIFPNGMLPSASQLSKAWQGLFVLEDWHNFGTYYDPTLMAWLKNFEESWDSIKHNYDERFYRMWRYFLCVSAASFRSRKNHLWHIVLTKPVRLGMYKSVR
ncbi:cyclopropane fatty acyl phospholipid synthase [Pedobacter sp. SD-b]|uniref:Cyclopropane fatty acyl phospholipid synthase n=1 Tax=Pedobacter segetis TaxID=2793069 RepID=A0ABS1BLT0_9SPHI|nr:cyclopropane fatty acyl phospholipid synthase [Pedobacter segetis]MBK0383852.1 cyclopropane fatty acyl phospholipid synthase [Pedobacter segetis]